MADRKILTRRRVLGAGIATGAAALGGYALLAPAFAQSDGGDAPAGEVQEMILGSADAPIEVIEYGSFTCPHCARFHEEVYPLLKANYIETGKVKFVYREVYFDGPGLWAAMIARCGGPERYFGLAELLFKRQSDWALHNDVSGVVNGLYQIGRIAGLEDDAMKACVTDEAQARLLVANYQKNVEADGIEGTPTFLINGTKMSNMPYSEFKEVLDGLLAG
ncbi:MAG: DsbA family protein [Paracoccaceae bacterium]